MQVRQNNHLHRCRMLLVVREVCHLMQLHAHDRGIRHYLFPFFQVQQLIILIKGFFLAQCPGLDLVKQVISYFVHLIIEVIVTFYQRKQLGCEPPYDILIINDEIYHSILCIYIENFKAVVALVVFGSVLEHYCNHIAVTVVGVGLYPCFFLFGIEI